MRLHLVSLALLLLALCRPSSSSASVLSITTATTGTKTSITADQKNAEMVKIAPKLDDAGKVAKADELLGNTLYAMILKAIDDNGTPKFDNLPRFYKNAIINGVQCELANPDLDENIIKLVYGVPGGKMTDVLYDEEKNKFLTYHNIVCGATPVGLGAACWCAAAATVDKRKSLLYCIAKEFAEKLLPDDDFVKAPLCVEAALKEFEKVAPTYTDGNKAGTKTSEAVPEADDIAKFYCEASSAKVEKAIKNVYAADATLWTLDAIISGITSVALSKKFGLTNPDKDDIETSCKEDAFKDSPFGKCVCDLDKGILLFCYPHLMGKKLQELKYLDCTVEPDETKPDTGKFDAANKPAALPDIMIPAKEVTKTPSNTTETTTAGPNSAATSSLLLAAAVVLLGQ